MNVSYNIHNKTINSLFKFINQEQFYFTNRVEITQYIKD